MYENSEWVDKKDYRVKSNHPAELFRYKVNRVKNRSEKEQKTENKTDDKIDISVKDIQYAERNGKA